MRDAGRQATERRRQAVSWEQRRAAWEAGRLAEALAGSPERHPRFSTISDVEVDRLYGPWSIGDADPGASIGLPGEPPFTRGIHPTGYRSRLWTMPGRFSPPMPLRSPTW